MFGQSATRTLTLRYLDPAATREPLLLKVTCVALVVNRVRMPSGSPSGNVWIWTVLLELAVTSLLFCGGKKTPQSNSDHVTNAAMFHPQNTDKVIQYESEVANLHSEGVHLFSNGDELWIVIIQTFPYPNISIVTTCYKEPGQRCVITVMSSHRWIN